MRFSKESPFYETVRDQIERYLYKAKEYYFLDIAQVEEGEDVQSDLFLLENEWRYRCFFSKLYTSSERFAVLSDLFVRIFDDADAEYALNALKILDERHKIYLMELFLRHRRPSYIIEGLSPKELEIFVSLAHRNSAFVDAVVDLESGAAFVPNCTYGFGIAGEGDLAGLYGEIAKPCGLEVALLRSGEV
jgi:hypothetical protein